MPGGDGSGPNGQGPMTGRGMGYCAGYTMPGYVQGRPFGMGFGRGRGRGRGIGYGRNFGYGRGWGNIPPTYSPTTVPVFSAPDEATINNNLKNEKEYLEARLAQIQKELESNKTNNNSDE